MKLVHLINNNQMNIYSNSIYQRMKNETIIESILREGFKAFYCLEEIFMGVNRPSGFIGIPMISFCDIPLVHVAKNNYGKCGIAMSRKWGRSKHLEPVLYYPNDISCQSTKMILKAYEEFVNNPTNYDGYRILGYAKPITKPTKIEGKSSNNYAEREWRKVYATPAPLKWKTRDEYEAYRGAREDPKQAVGTPIKFQVEDIDFILVDRNSAPALRNFIMNRLTNLCGAQTALSLDDKYILLSKILEFENLVHNL
ncbi:abortive infection system antitoxin AbiGi family protein [Alistipes putredinis]|uniref:abortive infection system antitoxin AbiGi family protein n=1 Tax=Alistipes putredinis TaxID=28117 RepID=UPI003A838980